jgi:DNA-binding CsgD family transcriptional regulator
MNKNLKNTRATAYLRQLCCSGLDKAVVIPEFLRAVQNVLPSANNSFIDVEKQFTPTDIIFDHAIENFQEFIYILLDYWTPSRIFRFASWFALHPVLTKAAIFDEHFEKSDLYNFVNCKYEQHHYMTASITHLGKPIGMMTLNRPRNMKPFDEHEQTVIVRLMPYMAHAMKATTNKDIEYCENGTTGIVVMDCQGSVLHQSQAAKKILALASSPVITSDAARLKVALLTKLAQLCRNLDTIYRGGDAAPPSWCHINSRGRFIFRAQWLDNPAREPGGLIGMTIEHQEPQLLKILRALQDTPLSPIQKEVAALLAQGASNEKICQTLHIKITTAKDHIKKIYTRLDIERREQLLPKLLAKLKEQLIQLH